MDIIEILGINIKKYRLNLNLSQEELAFRSGLHRTYLSDVERGNRNLSINSLGKIATALNLDTYELLKENKNER